MLFLGPLDTSDKNKTKYKTHTRSSKPQKALILKNTFSSHTIVYKRNTPINPSHFYSHLQMTRHIFPIPQFIFGLKRYPR